MESKEYLIFTWKPSTRKNHGTSHASHLNHGNPLYEKTVTPSSDTRTLTHDNLKLWILPLATLSSILVTSPDLLLLA